MSRLFELDLQITTISRGRNISMRITHIPTGEIVSGEDDRQYRLRQKLISELKDKVLDQIRPN